MPESVWRHAAGSGRAGSLVCDIHLEMLSLPRRPDHQDLAVPAVPIQVEESHGDGDHRPKCGDRPEFHQVPEACDADPHGIAYVCQVKRGQNGGEEAAQE
jgi:hypothetical protein